MVRGGEGRTNLDIEGQVDKGIGRRVTDYHESTYREKILRSRFDVVGDYGGKEAD